MTTEMGKVFVETLVSSIQGADHKENKNKLLTVVPVKSIKVQD